MTKITRLAGAVALALTMGTGVPGLISFSASAADTPAEQPVIQDSAPSTPAPMVEPPAPKSDPAPSPAAVQTPAAPVATPPAASAPVIAPEVSSVPAPAASAATQSIHRVAAAPAVAKTLAPKAEVTAPAIALPPVPSAATAEAATAKTVVDTPVAPSPAAVAAPTTVVVGDTRSDTMRALNSAIVPILLLILTAMAYAVWSITRSRRKEQTELLRQAAALKGQFWNAGTLQQGVQNLEPGSPFRYIGELGVHAADHENAALYAKINRRTWVVKVIQHARENVLGTLESRADALMPIAMSAPAVGLLGAAGVLFIAPAMAGGAANGIAPLAMAEALILAAVGLTISMLAMMSHNRLANGTDACIYPVRAFSADLQSALTGGFKEHAVNPQPVRAGAR